MLKQSLLIGYTNSSWINTKNYCWFEKISSLSFDFGDFQIFNRILVKTFIVFKYIEMKGTT